MKNLKILFVAFTLFAMTASAAVLNPVKPTDKLRAEIKEKGYYVDDTSKGSVVKKI